MYLTLQLILSHFLADYPLQPGSLVKLKYKKVVGVLLHALVHLVLMILLCIPFLYLQTVQLSLIIIFVTHLAIDFGKVTMDRNYPKINKFILYIGDQVAHMLVMLYCSILIIGKTEPAFAGGLYNYLSENAIFSFILVLTLVTYFYDVTRWTYRNSIESVAYKRDYRMMIKNAIIVAIAYGAYWVFK